MLCVAAYFSLMFISTIIQFWTSDYLKIVIKAESSMILVSFILTCLTAPVLGIITGGCIVQKFGGYESKNALNVCSVFGILAVLFAIFITQFDSLVGFATFLWIFLFFGGCIVPNLIGITLCSVPHELRAAASSSTNFFNSIFGFTPAPYFYGLLFNKTKHHSPKFAYGFSCTYSVVVFILIVLANYFRRKDFQTVTNEKEEISSKVEKSAEINFKKADFTNQQEIISNNNTRIANKHNNVIDVSDVKIEVIK